MTHIFSEETTGTSKRSLTHALAKSIQSALQNHGDTSANGGLKITVIIEGYVIENGEYKVNVKVLIIDPAIEQEDVYHETEKQLQDRFDANQELAEQMHSAIYAKPFVTDSNGVHALENQVNYMSETSELFTFNNTNDDITIIANPDFHSHINEEGKKPSDDRKPNIDGPSLDLGVGSSSSSTDKDAA